MHYPSLSDLVPGPFPAPEPERLEGTVLLDRPGVSDIIRQASAALEQAGSPTPRLDARVLLCSVLGLREEELYIRDEIELPEDRLELFRALLHRRQAGEPVAYLTGHKEFMALDFIVDRRVLIPRPETEHLVEEGVRFSRTKALAGDGLSLADLGTGSGAVAISVAKQLPKADIYALDISEDSLQVARVNARRHGVEHQIEFRRSDLLSALPARVDIIMANLPYTVLEELPESVRGYEPALALDGGPDGLELYRRFMEQTPECLNAGGGVFMEVDPRQVEELMGLARRVFSSAKVWTVQDLSGYDRLVAAALDG